MTLLCKWRKYTQLWKNSPCDINFFFYFKIFFQLDEIQRSPEVPKPKEPSRTEAPLIIAMSLCCRTRRWGRGVRDKVKHSDPQTHSLKHTHTKRSYLEHSGDDSKNLGFLKSCRCSPWRLWTRFHVRVFTLTIRGNEHLLIQSECLIMMIISCREKITANVDRAGLEIVTVAFTDPVRQVEEHLQSFDKTTSFCFSASERDTV